MRESSLHLVIALHRMGENRFSQSRLKRKWTEIIWDLDLVRRTSDEKMYGKCLSDSGQYYSATTPRIRIMAATLLIGGTPKKHRNVRGLSTWWKNIVTPWLCSPWKYGLLRTYHKHRICNLLYKWLGLVQHPDKVSAARHLSLFVRQIIWLRFLLRILRSSQCFLCIQENYE